MARPSPPTLVEILAAIVSLAAILGASATAQVAAQSQPDAAPPDRVAPAPSPRDTAPGSKASPDRAAPSPSETPIIEPPPTIDPTMTKAPPNPDVDRKAVIKPPPAGKEKVIPK